jgi:hypothetical protein
MSLNAPEVHILNSFSILFHTLEREVSHINMITIILLMAYRLIPAFASSSIGAIPLAN